jgi:hypothetical protein
MNKFVFDWGLGVWGSKGDLYEWVVIELQFEG